MDIRHVYKEKMDAQLKEWDAQWELLKAKADKMTGDAKIAFESKMRDLGSRRDDLRARLAASKESASDVWERMKLEADQIAADIKRRFDDLRR